MSSFKRRLLLKYLERTFTRRQKIDPVKNQLKILKNLLRKSRKTEFGKIHHFSQLFKGSDFYNKYRKSFPVMQYDDYRPFIEKILKGEKKILSTKKIQYLGHSSGTSSLQKIFPTTEKHIESNLLFGKNVVLNYLYKTQKTKILLGKFFGFNAFAHETPQYPGFIYGEMSGLISNLHHRKGKNKFTSKDYSAVSIQTESITNWEKKLEVTADETMNKNITMMAVNPPWALAFFDILIRRYNQTHQAKVKKVGQIWPELGLVICGGVAMNAYSHSIKQAIGLDHVDLIETYGATEGFMAYQDDPNDQGLLLNIDNDLFYEFIKIEDIHKKNPPRLHLGEVCLNQKYAILVSNLSGFFSYQIGDLIQFSSLCPHKILMCGRIHEVIDGWKEHISCNDLSNALNKTCHELNISVNNFHVAPYFEEKNNCHQWLIEFKDKLDNLEWFETKLDQILIELSVDYELFRGRSGFGRLKVFPLQEKTFYYYLKQTRPNLGGHTKVSMAQSNRKVADSLIEISNKSKLNVAHLNLPNNVKDAHSAQHEIRP